MSFSHVVVVGRVGKDPEVRATAGGKTVASFSIATDSGYGDNKTTDWVSTVLFDKAADIASKYVKKGSMVAVIGRLQTRSWDDKQSGEKKYKTEVVGSELKLLDKAMSGESSPAKGRSSAPAASRPQAAPAARPSTSDDAFGDDDSIPF
jgi:single-strand DNA-binding protein